MGREKDSHFFVTMSGFNSPGTLARYDFTAPEEQRWSIYMTTKVKGLNPDDFEAQQVGSCNDERCLSRFLNVCSGLVRE